MEGAQATLDNNGVSRDLVEINLFPTEKEGGGEAEEKEEVDEVELSLGLSLNGRFGVDRPSKRLRRSSSVSNVGFGDGAVGGEQARGVVVEGHAPLVRTCSLPAGAEEWRRQKESQCLRSMEARRNRMEKMKNVRDGSTGVLHEAVNPSVQVIDNGNGSGIKMWNFIPTADGSIGSSSGSSGIPDYQSQHRMGTNPNPAMMGSSSSHQFRPEPAAAAAARAPDNNNNSNSREGEMVKNELINMPYVSTTGPNANKIEGFLYRYRTGEEVKIVCVCHGMFLSPADFVKHSGGGDVAQPLRHIVVNPFPIF